MISCKASDLRRRAQEQLGKATAPKRLVLLHTLVALGSALLIAGLNILFNSLIADTGGLSGMGARSILSTVQTLLETAVMMALPFWQISLSFLALCWARNIYTRTGDLLQGFRRLGSVLGFRLLYGLVFFVLGLAALYLSSAIFMMTPFSAPILEEFAPLMDPAATAQQIETLFSPEQMEAMAGKMTPFFILFGIVFILAAIPVFYRLRLGEFALMDGMGGGGALLCSFRLTRKNWRHLVKLDLSFWWFYGLQVLCNLIGNGDRLLPYLGIHLPVSESAAYFLFLALGTALQLLVLWQFQGQVLTSYAVLYDDLSPLREEPFTKQSP